MVPSGSSRMLNSPGSNNAFSPNVSPETQRLEDRRSNGCRQGPILTTPFMDTRFRSLYPPSSDPFLTPAGPANRARLSATAASFTPVSSSRNGIGRIQPQRLAFNPASPTREVVNSSVGARNQEVVQYARIPSNPRFGDAQLIRANVPSSPQAEQLDSERCSRFLMIGNVPTNLSCVMLSGFFNRREFPTIKGPVLGELSINGNIYVTFADSREAQRAVYKVRHVRPEWRVVQLTARDYAQFAEPTLLGQVSDYDGQLLVAAIDNGGNINTNCNIVARSVESIIVSFGDIKTFSALHSTQRNALNFQVEFYNSHAAESAVVALNNVTVDGYSLRASPYRPEESQRYTPAAATPVRGEPSGYNALTPTSDVNRAVHTPRMELSPTGRSSITPTDHAHASDLLDWLARSGEVVRRSPRGYRGFRMPNQNAVDVERIRLGLDVRTTVMLRNIPNKIDQATLKTIVDETSIGKYDFMYLRIDFMNNCNVGYAFINFEDPIDIIEFVNARAGHTWDCFQSDKVAEVSYATIQGRDCLIQKFRNSSVMVENPMFRPKIFHTGTGPLAGTEDVFPPPDNASKMRRSMENAGNVGLFPPRSSLVYREEQRRCYPPFYRGTTAAEYGLRRPADVNEHRAGGNNPLRSAPLPLQYPRRDGRDLAWYGPAVAERGPHTA